MKHLKQPWGSQGKKINFSFGASHEVLIDYSLKCSLTNEKEKLKLVLQILKFQSFQVPLTQNIPLFAFTVIINVTQMTCTIIVNGKRVNL